MLHSLLFILEIKKVNVYICITKLNLAKKNSELNSKKTTKMT